MAVILVLGAVMTVVSRSKNSKKAEPESVEAMTTEVETAPVPTQAAVWPPIDLHPMVAQLKAELAGSHMPIESVPIHRLEETPGPARVQPLVTTAPPAPPTQPTPSTVIVGMVPVQKKEEKRIPVEEKLHTEEEAKAADEKGPS